MLRSAALLIFVLTILGSARAADRLPDVEGDPYEVQRYVLDNGLTVYLSVNDREPRIYTSIVVRAGSAQDPADATGLAHYLEHMMFKGTDEMGTIDWEVEQDLLERIADLYEAHRRANEAERAAIYRRIDSLSVVASKYAVPNEYDKLVSSMGAERTNAYTSNDQTVYLNDIPSNQLERWIRLERERFSTLVLRLFHTEMETVYEEFNRAQDNDRRWAYQAVLEDLYPDHPYGTQTTIGLGEHLKTPSMHEIRRYFETYYVPGNMAICLAGNLDPDQTIAWIDEHFGTLPDAEVPDRGTATPSSLSNVVRDTVRGPNTPMLYLGYPLEGAHSRDHLLATVVDMLLNNGRAGLLDLDVVQAQKVLQAASFVWSKTDHTTHFLFGVPRAGQTLADVEALLVDQVSRIAAGDFSDELLRSVKNDLRIRRMEALEGNRSRVSPMVDAFVHGTDWETVARWEDRIDAVDRAEVIAFAREHYDGYAVCYKIEGESDRHQVPKPPISQVHLNRDQRSVFREEFENGEVQPIDPRFIDFEADLRRTDIGQMEFRHLPNEVNDLFELRYVFDLGRRHDDRLALAVRYLDYLGTDDLPAADLRRTLYALGVDIGVNVGDHRSTITLSGLAENLDKALFYLDDLLRHAAPDSSAYAALVQDILKKRADARMDKGSILWRGLASHARYGATNPTTDRLSDEELRGIDPAALTELLSGLLDHPHRCFYYGPDDAEDVRARIAAAHDTDFPAADMPRATRYEDVLPDHAGKVFYTPYPMKQAEVLLMRRADPFNPDLLPFILVFNQYFGSGLSSIVFQEVREQRGLAYSAFAAMSMPDRPDEDHLVRAYLGVQADKLGEAVVVMEELLTDMPVVEDQFETARSSALQSLRTDWRTGPSVYSTYERARARGLDRDIRRDAFEAIREMTADDLVDFFNEHVRGADWVVCAVGEDDEALRNALGEVGTLRTLSVDEILP